jgi:glyoxylase-like metal-dependent hydrolase (beta-lactamase superfamily II)
MDGIPLPSDEIVKLDHFAPGVSGLRVLFVNVFGIAGPKGWTLVDAGLVFSASRIMEWAKEHFGGGLPQSIILTHGHFDHVGAVAELLEHWNVPVYAHERELPYLTQRLKYPPPDPGAGGGLMAVISPLYPRTSADLSGRVQALPENGAVPSLPGWSYMHTPGHAPGHISLFRGEDNVLLPGDAFCSTKQESLLAVAQQRPELHGPPAYYTPDWDAARTSVRKLAALRPTTIAPSHGLPMSDGEVPYQLDELAANFDEIAIPEHLRYVGRSGSAD